MSNHQNIQFAGIVQKMNLIFLDKLHPISGLCWCFSYTGHILRLCEKKATIISRAKSFDCLNFKSHSTYATNHEKKCENFVSASFSLVSFKHPLGAIVWSIIFSNCMKCGVIEVYLNSNNFHATYSM